MPRSAPSKADQQLIEYARQRGVSVTGRQLERWRGSGLLPPNIRDYPGRGRGSTSVPPPGAAELVAWLAANERPGRRPDDVALLAFAAGLAVPEDTVRSAFSAVIDGIKLPVEAGMPGAAPEEVADAAVAAGLRGTMLPGRIRLIDQALAQRGVDWSVPEIAGMDPGRSDDPPTVRDWVYTGVLAILGGGASLNMATIGWIARIMAPGGVSPIAGQVEYGWPASPAEERDSAPDDDEVLGLLGDGDMRDYTRELIAAAPAAELLDAYRTAEAMAAWADSACSAVEREIADGKPGDAIREWVMASLGTARLIMAIALQHEDAGPASTAATAAVLIMIRTMIRTVRDGLPGWNFDVLKNPMIAPVCLTDFLGR
jgi:hypothetical protein